jgi:AmmeMemoRadiSam system protein B
VYGPVPAATVTETLRLFNVLTAFEPVCYATSADVTGDLTRVVGYAVVVVG